MGIYLIADPHLGHEKVAGIRGFSSSAGHDAWFFRNWEKAVSEVARTARQPPWNKVPHQWQSR